MHHLYPSLKGDQLCPLGFHPQTRYPTRCKRCFRDYKEHGARRGVDDIAASSPNLSDGLNSRPSAPSWTSTQNLSSLNGMSEKNDIELKKRPLSWASTPDIDNNDAKLKSKTTHISSSCTDESNINVTIKLPTPPRRHTTTLDLKEVESSLRSSASQSSSAASSSKNISDDLVIHSSDSLAERVRKMNLLKKQRSLQSRENSRERSVPKKTANDSSETSNKSDRKDRSNSNTTIAESKNSTLPPKKASGSSLSSSSLNYSSKSADSLTMNGISNSNTRIETSSNSSNSSKATSQSNTLSKVSPVRAKDSENIKYSINSGDSKTESKGKSSNETLSNSISAKLSASNEAALKEENKNLRLELEKVKTRMERAERDKSDILLKRLASMETAPNRTAASEALMLQQRVNQLTEQLEKVNEEKRRLNMKMKRFESNPNNVENDLKQKLTAAEQICEELMEENQEAKREIMNLQAEMEELQDNFRDDEVKARANLQKDFERATKNCRILSFKLKKCERKIESLEQEKQSGQSSEMVAKMKKLEEELRFSNELTKKLQVEADELRNPGKKKAPMLGVLGKSTSADATITRESLTRGGSQEDPQQILRDLQDSVERESDLKDQLKFAEEEAESLRKKLARFEDENDSLMIQLKKMATRNRPGRKSSPTPRRNRLDVHNERDEGISDDDDPVELRVLLELNEQEASKLRQKVEDLEKQNYEARKQVKELQDKLLKDASSTSGKKLKALSDELLLLHKANVEKERKIEKLESESKKNNGTGSFDMKRQFDLLEQEASLLRFKLTNLENDNKKLLTEAKLRGKKSETIELVDRLKESLAAVEQERDQLNTKLKHMQMKADEKIPPRSPKRITDLTPKNHLKKWVEELEEEINEMRILVVNSGDEGVKVLESQQRNKEEELQKTKQKLALAEADIQRLTTLSYSSSKVADLESELEKSEAEIKKSQSKIKDLEDKIKKQESLINQEQSDKASQEAQYKNDKEKLSVLEKEYEKERKEKEKLETKLSQVEHEFSSATKAAEKLGEKMEKEIKELKSKALSFKSESKQVAALRKQIEALQRTLDEEKKKYDDLNTHWEKLSEETVMMRAQLTTEKQNLVAELSSAKQKLAEMDPIRVERTEFAKKLKEAQKKITDLEAKSIQGGYSEQEKMVLKNKLAEKEHEFDLLKRENEMNFDLVSQLRKENEDLNSKLNDFQRIEQAQFSLNGHNANLEAQIKALKMKLESSELQLKSEVAATRLRYEQQMKNLNNELTSMQRQCERFKKDRDAFKLMLESAQKKITELKANNTGRQSRGSMHSSDDDDKSKIAYLEQKVGNLEDQLVEAHLTVSKVKTELVSERSANEIKISEMQSKLNEFEEERVIGSGRTKIPGIKTKLELSWQKEREEQQRLLQETSTLARDLRQTLFEVERERDKERLETKRRLEQIKKSTEEELEEGRRKIAELQCDLLELRDVHAKLRTSNEKLRRERERHEKELIRRRLEQDGSERKISALLETVDDLVKIAPDLNHPSSNTENSLRVEKPNRKRGQSPTPTLTGSQISVALNRLAEASEDIRKFQRMNELEQEKSRIRRINMRRAASQENDPHASTSSVASAASSIRTSIRRSNNGSLLRKSLSLDHSLQKDQNVWRQDDGSISSIQSVDSELVGFGRDSSLDSRLSGGSTQSDIPKMPRKKKKSLMGKLRSLTKSGRNSESEISIQESDSDISVASDVRSSKKDLRGRLSGMFKRSGSASRTGSSEQISLEHRPVAVTIVGDEDGPEPRDPPTTNVKPIRSIAKPPPGAPATPSTKRRIVK